MITRGLPPATIPDYAPRTKTGRSVLHIIVEYQICSETNCLPPARDELNMDVAVGKLPLTQSLEGVRSRRPYVVSRTYGNRETRERLDRLKISRVGTF